MNEELKKRLNSTVTIKNALSKIIEAFVVFYGESERKNIAERFENLLIIGYCPPKSLKSLLMKFESNKSNELIEKFLSNIDIPGYTKEQLKHIIFNNNDLFSNTLHNIYHYIEYRNGEEDSKEQAVEFLQNFFPMVNTFNIDELIANNSFESLEFLIKKYIDLIEEFQQYLDEIKPYQNYSDNCEKLNDVLSFKYIKMYLDEIKENFTEDDFLELMMKLNDEFECYDVLTLNGRIRNYLGFSLDDAALIDSFSEKNDEILESETEPEWKKESIKNDRIAYFKNLGYDLGDNYDDYIKDSRIIACYPNKEFVKRILRIRERCYTKMMNEFYMSLDEYQINRRRIENEELLDHDDYYNANSYENNLTFVNPNVKRKEEGFISFPILCISMGIHDNALDHALIHELNHVYELTLRYVEKNYCYFVCGWDEIIIPITTDNETDLPKDINLEKEETKRNYELFDDAINELISQEISEIMHSLGIYVFNNKKTAIIDGNGYQEYMFLIKEFYDTYKKEIIASRKNGNMSVLLEKVGEENFNDLNELFNSFYNQVKNNRGMSRINDYNYLIVKRDEILARMKEYSDTKVA